MVFAMYKRFSMYREKEMTFMNNDMAIAGFFAGDYAAVHKFYDAFWKIHNYFGEKKEYIGQEQHVFSTYLLYVGNSWVQPNYRGTKCNVWFTTFSYYGDYNMCFRKREPLRRVNDMVRRYKYVNL